MPLCTHLVTIPFVDWLQCILPVFRITNIKLLGLTISPEYCTDMFHATLHTSCDHCICWLATVYLACLQNHQHSGVPCHFAPILLPFHLLTGYSVSCLSSESPTFRCSLPLCTHLVTIPFVDWLQCILPVFRITNIQVFPAIPGYLFDIFLCLEFQQLGTYSFLYWRSNSQWTVSLLSLGWMVLVLFFFLSFFVLLLLFFVFCCCCFLVFFFVF